MDLRKDIQFNTTVTSAHFNEDTQRWSVQTDSGEDIDTQFLISCTGMLSAPLDNQFDGQDSFKGRIFHTARWPKEDIDFSNKRVGMIGIGATGIQVIQTIAEKVGHMNVFIRTPQYVNMMKNPKYTDEDIAEYKSNFEKMQKYLPHSFSGFNFDHTQGSWG